GGVGGRRGGGWWGSRRGGSASRLPRRSAREGGRLPSEGDRDGQLLLAAIHLERQLVARSACGDDVAQRVGRGDPLPGGGDDDVATHHVVLAGDRRMDGSALETGSRCAGVRLGPFAPDAGRPRQEAPLGRAPREGPPG